MVKKTLLRVVLCAIAVAALVGAGASAASAQTFELTTTACTGGKNVALCYETAKKEKLELKGEQEETVEGGTVTLSVKTEPKILITCKKSTGSGVIKQLEPLVEGKKTTLTGTLTYKECVLTEGPKQCKVKTEETTKPLTGTLESETTLKLVPTTPTTFIEATFESNTGETCPATFIGKRPITGEESVTITEPGKAEAKKSGKAADTKLLLFFSDEATLTQELTMSFGKLEDNVYVSKEA